MLLDIRTSLPCAGYKHCTEKADFSKNLTAGMPQHSDLFLVVSLEETQTLTVFVQTLLKSKSGFCKTWVSNNTLQG